MNKTTLSSIISLKILQKFISDLYERANLNNKKITLKIDNILSGSASNIEKLNDCIKKVENTIHQNNNNNQDSYKYLQALLANVSLKGGSKNNNKAYYKLEASTIDSIFPVEEGSLKQDYKKLICEFEKQLEKIPKSHEANLELWLDHFCSLFEIFAQNIPAFKGDCDLSLFDYAKTVCALTTAMYFSDNEKLLLIQGDFFGIQEFIFANGGETNKNASKLLRGRSFYVSLLMEIASLKLIQELNLNSTVNIINAAGKFIILVADSQENRTKIAKVSQEINEWFAKYTYYQSGIGLAYVDANLEDFKAENYNTLIKKLFEKLERAKFQRHSLASVNATNVISSYLDDISEKGVCAINGVSPAEVKKDDLFISQLANNHIKVGEFLTKFERILVTKENINHNTLDLNIFGYYISFTQDEDITGKFGNLAKGNILNRVFDFSLPEFDSTKIQFNGYGRRIINAYVPTDLNNNIIPFDELATKDQKQENDEKIGISAITTVKGDVDDLGAIFQKGIKEASFAKYTALSRQLNTFFSAYLPYLCANEYSNMYTVFAGGDDFFLIGPWKTAIDFAHKMQKDFEEYVNKNAEIHFSTGLSTTKVGIPVPSIADFAEEALEKAKAFYGKEDIPKNAINCFGQSIKWNEFKGLKAKSDDIEFKTQNLNLSTAYIYSMLHFIRMANSVHKDKDPRKNIWKSRFRYKTYRMLQQKNISDIEIQMQELQELFETNIEKYKKQFRIPLFINLYLKRK